MSGKKTVFPGARRRIHSATVRRIADTCWRQRSHAAREFETTAGGFRSAAGRRITHSRRGQRDNAAIGEFQPAADFRAVSGPDNRGRAARHDHRIDRNDFVVHQFHRRGGGATNPPTGGGTMPPSGGSTHQHGFPYWMLYNPGADPTRHSGYRNEGLWSTKTQPARILPEEISPGVGTHHCRSLRPTKPKS